ncbi:S-adenosyl-L-methionine-dependent tRNA 4-demethylwyosine synthase [Acrasis kona]|uniref:S-adenosyl-L-methionine-dependent tRNA 4-demethylwyosine synthase n=1 Tax=Acrasis kona TaxID=1008807 RepID=A0AAW2YL94_9EUKA
MTTITITTADTTNTPSSRISKSPSNFSKSPGFKQRVMLPSSMNISNEQKSASPSMYSSYETINLAGDRKTQSQEDLLKSMSSLELPTNEPIRTHSRRMGIVVVILASVMILCQIAVIACLAYSLYGYSEFRMYRNGGVYMAMTVILPILLVISVLFIITGVIGISSVWGSKRAQSITGFLYAALITFLMISEIVAIVVILTYNVKEVTKVFVPLMIVSFVGYLILVILTTARLFIMRREEALHKGSA